MNDSHDVSHDGVEAKHESVHLDTVAVHLAHLRRGKIIAFTGDDADIGNWNIGKSSLWDPANPHIKENPRLGRNLFCSGHCFLSDGRLLIAGGQSTVSPLTELLLGRLMTIVTLKEIELYDPEKDSWNIIDTLDRDRLYHSSALLLTDGRVIAAGSTGHKWSTNPEHYEKEIEILIPPYLKDNPQRPKITDCPLDIHYDRDFEIKTDTSDISKVVIIKNSSTTHNNNMDERYVLLTILEQVSDILKISGPKDGTYAPPGYYMLFILDKKNIPSVAEMVRIG